jgi:hypothetical protein
VPAVLAFRSRPRPGLAEVALSALVASPFGLAAAAGVRALEDHWDENLTLPWDAGLVPPYLTAAFAAFGVVAALQWARRRSLSS